MNNSSGFRKFLLLWAGKLISSIGGGLTSFGLAVYVFNETGSAASMAIVSLLAFFPTLILSAPAGVLADRYDRRLLLIIDICTLISLGKFFSIIINVISQISLFFNGYLPSAILSGFACEH